jgi:hypothetical protein
MVMFKVWFIDASNNLYFVYYDYDTSSYEITKITQMEQHQY